MVGRMSGGTRDVGVFFCGDALCSNGGLLGSNGFGLWSEGIFYFGIRHHGDDNNDHEEEEEEEDDET